MKKLIVSMIVIAAVLCAEAYTIEVSTSFDYYLDYTDGIASGGRNRIPMPKAYEFGERISGFGNNDSFNNPKDMHVSSDGTLYVADTGNNRIVVIDCNGAVKRIIGDGMELNDPQGVFVAGNKDIYIADTGNSRILRLDERGKLLNVYGRPTSDLIDQEEIFSPRQVVVSDIGFIYLISGDSLMSLDQNGSFKGYVGETKLSFNLIRLLVRTFATSAQKKQLPAPVRAHFKAVSLSDDGFIYGLTNDLYTGQIRKINSIGKNLYPAGFYGEVSAENNQTVYSNFSAIDVNDLGIISVVDSVNCKIYQFDHEGNNLCVFGGGKAPDKKGNIFIPVAIGSDNTGKLYLLDSGTGSIQSFIPTDSIKAVHKAIYDYSQGNYSDAKAQYTQILSGNSNYKLAHKGLGDSYYKLKDWEKAMHEYKLADDKVSYSKAFEKSRMDFSEDNFLLVATVFILALAVFFLCVFRFRRFSLKVIERYYGIRKG